MSYDTKSIRDFLLHRFNDGELTQFCFDYFLDVYHDFSDSWSKGDKIQELLEHCLAHGRFPELMAALERERPGAYHDHFPEPPPVETAVSVPRPAAPRNPRQVFISYAHQDAEFARRLTADLQAHGLPVWIAPDSIQPGEKWVEAINRGLEESGVFLLALTETAVSSPWVKDETNVAIELSKESELRFIPLEVKPCTVPPLWRVYQRILFHADYEAGLQTLLVELGIEAETAVSRQSLPQKKETPDWGDRLRSLPIWAWSVGAVLLLAVSFAVIQLSRPETPAAIATVTPEGETAVPATPTQIGEATPSEPVAGDIHVWPGFLEAAFFQGEIGLNESAARQLRPGETDTWLFRGGPKQIDIMVEGRPNDNHLIRLYNVNALDWDEFIPPRGNTEGHVIQSGQQLITFFEVVSDDDTIIAVTDLNGDGSDYRLTVSESMPEEIARGETVNGALFGDNPGVWRYHGEPATVNLILQLDRGDEGLIFVVNENGRTLAYVDTGNAANEWRIQDFSIEEGDAIIVRDTSNTGADYTLTVETTGAAPTNTPPPELTPVVISIPVEIDGNIFEIAATHTVNPSPGTVTFQFQKQTTSKDWVDVEIQRTGNGAQITTSGRLNDDAWREQQFALSQLAGERIKIFRWAPGLFGAAGSGGGEAFLTLPETGSVEITIVVAD